MNALIGRGRKGLDHRWRENHSENSNNRKDHGQRPKKAIGKVPHFLFRLFPHPRCEDGNKRSGHRPLTDKPAEKVWYAVRENKGIGGERSAEQKDDALIADVAEDAAGDSDEARTI